MVATLAEVFWEVFAQAFGSNILLFAFATFFFAAIFFVTRQSLASSMVLGIIALEGMQRTANEPFIDIFVLGLRILILGVIGFVFASSVFKK